MKKSKIAVLMSTFNGERYLERQIETVMNQKNVDVYLFIRDDGSTDNTIKILNNYKSNKKIQVFYGNNIGYASSFWTLMGLVGDFDYYAFCDQDDIWLEDKLYAGISKMVEINEPALYTSKVVSVNNNIEILNLNAFNNYCKLNVYQSFQKSVFPGCVFIFNNKAKLILEKYNGFMESHDWAAYAIISVFGKTVYDDNSHIYYRIHDGNTIGKKNKISEFFNKFFRFFRKSKCTRSRFAKDFYNTFKNAIPSKYIDDIYALANYKHSFKQKISLLTSKNYKGFIFKLYVLIGKV